MSYAIEQLNEARALSGNLGGAPATIITPELMAQAKRFVDGEWEQYNKTIPTVEGLAKHLKLYRRYIYESQELADTLEWIQQTQASRLIEYGLTNEYNPSIVKLLLSSKHGYIERSEVSQNHSIVAQPSEAIASDFSAYVKAKTEALPESAAPDA